MTIREYINSTKTPNRDKIVIERINNFYKNNGDALNDGIINDYIIIGDLIIERLLEPYNIDWDKWKTFKKENKVLQQGHNVVNKPINLALMTSYFSTRDRIFLDMMGAIEIGSKFKKYFKHGVSSPEKMKYVIEHKLNNKSLIKRYGSLFLVVQEQIKTMVESPVLKEKWKRGNDRDLQELINRMSTSINSTIKNISQEYYKFLDEETESNIITQSELNIEGAKASLSNNSVDVQNLKNIVDNYTPTNIDYEVLKVVRCNSPVKKFVMKKVLLDKSKGYFSKLGVIFIDYYVEKYGGSINEMKKDFVPKLMVGRLNNPVYKNIIDSIVKDVKSYALQYESETENETGEGITSNVGAYSFTVNELKGYIIIKIRKIMNDL